MSRSKKKTPITGITCCESEKFDKKLAHKRYRKTIKDTIQSVHGDIHVLNNTVLPTEEEISDVWVYAKDGKHYFGNKKNWFGKLFDKLMRK